ncbi:MAG: SRPBCC family protein, partial [bacterium]
MSKNEQILAEFRKKGVEQLLPMVESGQVTQVLEEGRKIKGIMSACLVNTTEEKAWEVLLDYDNYRRFLPGIQTSKVLSRKDDEVVVKFVAGVKVMGIGGTVKYTYRFKINKPYVDAYDTEKRELNGYWA